MRLLKMFLFYLKMHTTATPTNTNYILTESGNIFITESGNRITQE